MQLKFKLDNVAFSNIVLFYNFLYAMLPNTTTSNILYYLPYIFSIIAVFLLYDKKTISMVFRERYFIWRILLLAWAISSYLFISISKEDAFFYLKILLLQSIVLLQVYLTICRSSLLSVIKVFYFSAIIALLYILCIADYSKIFMFRLGIDVLGENWNSNTVGIIAGYAFVLLLFIRNRLDPKNHIYVATQILCLFVVIVSGSRTALLIFLVGLLGFRLVSSDNPIKLFGNIIMIVAIVFVSYYLLLHVPFMYEIMGQRIEHIIDYLKDGSIESGSVRWRSLMIEEGLAFFANKPVFGYGLNGFKVLFGNIHSMARTYAHNNYIELLVDGGIVGLIVYYLKHFSMILRYRKNKCPYKKFVIVMLIMILAVDYCTVSIISMLSQFVLLVTSYYFDNESEFES